MFYYAQINDQGLVVGVSTLSGEVENPRMVQIESEDPGLVGRKYENGVFIEVPKSKNQLLTELKDAYYQPLKDAELFGDEAELTRLRQEYLQKKTEIESA